ncbi:efflux RND transporter periplasmic adaptor subunit [Pseudodesulfovibrio cashew]|uniref:Efflux RND transporter periplasmic adaptor subunit n=1 Tax=Pseudodesulfovibrio cashew TaxID=2678688 RepID=A0A6I6JFV7_9BACT|nr:efflux RND transporter periplasmic adaptor subunit [Pseudodesulfovibrio cashew]QGY39292.1 efflux RND transporter periplasmic adaptor subunit [Pseudodesulfovibrio cashew]
MYNKVSTPPRAATLLALACLLLTVVLAGCDEKTSEAKGAPAAPVEVGIIALHPQAVPLNTELPGRTTASLVAEVRPQVDGIIRERLFREGSEVHAGEVLYRVAPSTYQAEYSNALAALKRAQASLPSSESKAKRYAELIGQGAISKQDYQDAKAVFEADLAAVASAKAALESAKISLDYTEIKAPISGRVEMSDLTPGALVTANQSAPLTTIRQLDPINVDLTQSSTTMLNLRQAIASGVITVEGKTMTVKLKLENGTVYPYEGTVEFSGAKVDEATGTYTLRAEFPNPDRLLLPGMYVRAIIQDGVFQNCYLVPQRAVGRTPKGEPVGLFVDKDGKVEQRILDVRRSYGNSWLVGSGISDGDRLVVQGSQFIRAGQTVTVKEMILDDATGEIRPAQAPATPAAESKEG